MIAAVRLKADARVTQLAHLTRRNLPHLLLLAREAAMSHFRPILNHVGLTEQQWRILRTLDEAGSAMEPHRIADTCKISSPSLSGILARMADAGLIERARSTVDQRRQSVRLSKRGMRVVARMAPLVEAQYRHIETAVGIEELERMYAALDALMAMLARDIPSVIHADDRRATVPASRRKPTRVRDEDE